LLVAKSPWEAHVRLILLALGGVMLILTVLSRVRSARWWIRFADFPRIQIACGLVVVLILYAAVVGWRTSVDAVFSLALLAALAYQASRIFPYTPLAPKQVQLARRPDPTRCIRILISNVLMENRKADRLLGLIRERDPDLLLALETDDWWREQLEVLDGDYPFRLKQPQGNYYGLHFFSKLELRLPQVRFLVEDDIPSVRASIRLRSGDWIEFYGLHPRPPQVEEDTETRDAELLMVGREIRADGRPSIVAGDLNDVAWSHTTRLFQRISGCLDPRKGRGMFNSFHANYPVFRWPLDHIFHEPSFTLVHLERLPNIGSDHFPVFVELCYEPAAEARQAAPQPAREDLEEAQEKIEEGCEAARVDGQAVCRAPGRR
jgi:endonuclease/exonuclease/phosphatase (EEP) superfamily protein YafD